MESIVAIANELNLGTDSFVFIDDNPVERDAVRQALPDVVVPELPSQVEQLATWFMQQIVPTYFGKYAISKEDAAKTEQYRANQRAAKACGQFRSRCLSRRAWH